jgi:predicted aldo/keto reductase-like oxidoreductase
MLLQNEKVMRYAKRNGIGVSVMGPVAGGRLAPARNFRSAVPGRKLTAPEAALLYVFSNRNVNTALSGMTTEKQLRENLHTVNNLKPLRKDERVLLDGKARDLKALCDLYCTGCGYCQPCPHAVAISAIFGLVNTKRVYGMRKVAHDTYERYRRNKWSAEYCRKCGKCMSRCPQGINIIAQLEEAHRILAAGGRKR